MRNTKKGFTLVELLVVIAILAVLATVSVVGYTSFINNANNSVAQQELTQIRDYVIAQEYLGGVTVDQALVDELGLKGKLEEGTVEGKTCYRYTLNKGVAYWLTEKNEVKVDLTGWTAVEGGTTGGDEGGESGENACTSICEICDKCKDSTCEDVDHTEKCEGHAPETFELTITFDSTDKRTVYSTSQQVWVENGIIVTNNKTTSTTNVGNYYDPARFYKNSELIIEAIEIETIIFNCPPATSDDDYADALKNSIASDDNITVTVDGSVVTVTFAEPVDSFTIVAMSKQVRVNYIVIKYTVEPHNCSANSIDVAAVAPTCTVDGTTAGTKCSKCGTILSGVEVDPALYHIDEDTNHACDRGCDDVVIGDHEDNDGDGDCDYGCTTPIATTPTFAKATSIAVGDKIVFVYETSKKELSSISTTSTKYGIGEDYTDAPAGVMVFEVVAGSTDGTFAFKNGDKYLYWTSGNSLNTSSTLDAKTSWTVEFDGDGNAIVTNVNATERTIRWNNSSPRFACYESGQQAIQIYKQIDN